MLEILGVNTKQHHGTETESPSKESSCTVNQTVSTNDEATSVVMEILEERISVAIEVSTLIHQTAETEHLKQEQVIHRSQR